MSEPSPVALRNPAVEHAAGAAADAATREAGPGFAGRQMELLLYGLQSPINIGIILRIAEAYQFRVALFDRHGVLQNAEKALTIKDFSCGALTRRAFRSVADVGELEHLRHGRRLIATSIGVDACPLDAFRFQPGDLLTLGNEYDGLPAELIDRAEARLHIPMPPVWMPKEPSSDPIDPSRTAPVAHDGQPNLNVAVTAGILCYAAYAQWLRAPSAGPAPPPI